MIVNNNSNPNITAKTITAGKDTSTNKLVNAPTNNPITKENAVNKIVAIIPKQFLFWVGLLS